MTRLLEPAGLGEKALSTTLGSVMRGGVDYADLYFQVTRQESWTLEDGIIREGSFSVDQGVGVRANSGEKTGFAYSDELILPALESAAGAARAIARQGQDKQVRAWQRSSAQPLYPQTDPTTSIDDAQKTQLLLDIDAATRGLDPRVEQVIVSMASSQELVLVAASDGTMAADVRPLIRLNVVVRRRFRPGLTRTSLKERRILVFNNCQLLSAGITLQLFQVDILGNNIICFASRASYYYVGHSSFSLNRIIRLAAVLRVGCDQSKTLVNREWS